MKTKPLLRKVIGLPQHRANRTVDAPSRAGGAEGAEVEGGPIGRHRHGLAEVFRRKLQTALAERAAQERD